MYIYILYFILYFISYNIISYHIISYHIISYIIVDTYASLMLNLNLKDNGVGAAMICEDAL